MVGRQIMDTSYLELQRVLGEVREILVGSRIENLYHMEDDSVILKLVKDGGRYELRIVPGKCIYLVQGSYPKPLEISSRGKSLRELVSGFRIRDAVVVEGERVVVMEAEKGDSRIKIIAELMPRGSLIVADQGGRILESLHHLSMKDRKVMPGETYAPPPPKPTAFDNPDKLPSMLKPGRKLVSSLASDAGLGGRYAEELVKIAGLDGSMKVSQLSGGDFKRLVEALKSLRERVSKGRPVLAERDGEYQALPYPLESFKDRGWRFREQDSLNSAFREAYERLLARMIEEERLRRVREEAERLKDKARELRYTAENLGREAERKRRLAEKLFQAGWMLEEMRKNMRGGEAMGVKVEIDRDSGRMHVNVDGEAVEFKLSRSIMKQVSELFEDAKKAEEASGRLIREAEEHERKAEELLSRGERELEEAYLRISARLSRQTGKWYERYRWFMTSEGFLTVAGKDASSNTSLLKKHMEEDDLVFHAEVRGAPAVLLKNGAKAREESRIEAAQFAASYSRAWREGMTSMTVYYVSPSQVSFSPPPGHYLPKGGFIVKGERRYLTVRLELAIGLTETLDVIYGPPQAVRKKAKRYVVIVPGREKASELSDKILRKLTDGLVIERKTLRDLKHIIQQVIPYGVGRISQEA